MCFFLLAPCIISEVMTGSINKQCPEDKLDLASCDCSSTDGMSSQGQQRSCGVPVQLHPCRERVSPVTFLMRCS